MGALPEDLELELVELNKTVNVNIFCIGIGIKVFGNWFNVLVFRGFDNKYWTVKLIKIEI